ncbi:PKD domain-containing protein [Solirubrobacter taibaiensis]|nr:PKD domain-containing protein [Solirubrobacter taibaiensis]
MNRPLLALCLTTAAALAVPSMASAAGKAEMYTHDLQSETANIGSYHIGGHDIFKIAEFDVDVAAKASWSGELQTVVGWDSANVRQGASLTVNRNTPLQTGELKVSWKVSGRVDVGDFAGGAFTTKNLSVNAFCMPKLLGGAYTCEAESPAVTLVKTPGLPGSPYVKVVLKAKFAITPEGVIHSRSFTVGGASAGSASGLSLSPLFQNETLKVPCAPVGSGASYRIGSPRFSPAVAVTQQPAIQVGFMDPVLGLTETPAVVDAPFGSAIKTTPAFVLAGTGHSTDLGDLLPNNVAPTIAPLGTFTGSAGVPVKFSAGVTGRCEIATYMWKFSNGTTSYGATPSRTFSTPGAYDGELTVTDETGLVTKRNFSVNVS